MHGEAHDHDHDHGHGHGHGHGAAMTSYRGEPLARHAGKGKLLFLDTFSGIAGDMLVAALLDLGIPLSILEEALSSLPLSGYALKLSTRTRAAIVAPHLEVVVEQGQPQRDYASIRDMLDAAQDITSGARRIAQDAFRLLAEAEADVHGTTVEKVHFHEVGAVDSIVDIVAAAVGLDHLGARLICSPLPMGRGSIRSQHGTIPGPAPATVRCLTGVPTYGAGIDAELVTPTGACLVAATAQEFTSWPTMAPERVAYGAGTRELPDRPNLLRLVLGQPTAQSVAQPAHILIETNVDDMSGELAAIALTQAEAAGALDAWSTPIGMKKGRPAIMLSALANKEQANAVARALLSESTSLGVRLREVSRIERTRRMIQVNTSYGQVAVKVADGDGMPANLAPEFEDCRRLAEVAGVPVKQVYAAALAAALDVGGAD